MSLLCLILLVLFFSAYSHGDDTYNSRTPTCQLEPSTCGDLSIKYPFYLYNGTEKAPPPGYSYCGYPGLAILCDDDGKPTLRLDRDGYTVSSIDYANLTVSLADADIVDGGDACPTARHNVTIPKAFHLPTSTIAYLFFFTGCAFAPDADFAPNPNPKPARKPPTIKPITCAGSSDEAEPTTPTMSFVLPEREIPPKPKGWWQACQSVYRAPVLRDAVPDEAAQDPGWREGGYAKALRRGFQLSWERIGSGPCARCERFDGKCGYNGTGELLGCFCGANGALVDTDGCSKISDSAATRSGSKNRAIAGGAAAGGVLLIAGVIAVFFIRKRKQRKVTSSSKPVTSLSSGFFRGGKEEKNDIHNSSNHYTSAMSTFLCTVAGLQEILVQKKKSKETTRIESFLQKNGTIYPKRYTYVQVKRMTKSFAEKLGQGGFGAVYRGDLSDGRQIAVKMLKDYKTNGEDFINEVASISKTSHVNVVTLLGFCLQGSKRALIYDYMPNGSLEKYAFKENSKGENSQNSLGWEKLLVIAVGIARGLEYLHRGCNTRIVHFDIKPHNILLDQNFCPKISDFGLAKLCLNKESAISIGGARGTIGYIAPEVFSKQFGAVSSKSDVYSYGMMVLEMVGARDKNINANSASSTQYFPQWIYEHLDEYCVSASEINGEITEIARKMIVVGLWCIQLSAANRPTMTRVVEMLEGSTSGLELPPKVLLSS